MFDAGPASNPVNAADMVFTPLTPQAGQDQKGVHRYRTPLPLIPGVVGGVSSLRWLAVHTMDSAVPSQTLFRLRGLGAVQGGTSLVPISNLITTNTGWVHPGQSGGIVVDAASGG